MHHAIAAVLREHGGMKTDVLADQGVVVKRMPDVAMLEQGPADRPRTVGETLSDAPLMRGFLISDDNDNGSQ